MKRCTYSVILFALHSLSSIHEHANDLTAFSLCFLLLLLLTLRVWLGCFIHIDAHLGHVPPNTSTCVRAWNREYHRLIQAFAHIISGQFNGHTHRDSFTMFYSTHDNMPLNVAWTGGSGTSFIGLNSNYRLYTVEAHTFEVIDFETYIFNLTAANLTPDQPPTWFKEYSFREAFGVTDLSPYTLSKLVNITFRHDRRALHKVHIITQ